MANPKRKPEEHGGLEELEGRLGYQFSDRALLRRAITHRSFANEHAGVDEDNQRLEFLGDAVLGLVVAEALFRADTEAPEGVLSRRLSRLVCEEALVERANAIELGEFLRLGRGEEMTGGRAKDALLADAYEAVLGAVFLDAGEEGARQVILEHFEQAFDDVLAGRVTNRDRSGNDFKSLLQREVQSRKPIRPCYKIVETSGPPHDRRFVAEVLVDSTAVGRGEGRSKQEAEQAAAAEAVAQLEREDSRILRALGESPTSTTEN